MPTLSTIRVLLGKRLSVLDSDFANKHKESALYLKEIYSKLRTIGDLITGVDETKLEERGILLQEVEDVVYDADDLADEILFKDTRRKLVAESQKRAYLLGKINIRSLRERYGKGMQSKIKEIAKVVDSIKMRIELFHWPMQRRSGEFQSSDDSLRTTSSVDATEIVGRDEDRREIVSLLLSGNANPDGIAIVGMGGCGKTTLAQLVYNDDIVRKHFDIKAWISVSEDWDAHNITSAILEAMDPESLAGKRFLLVLDDVRNLDISKWESLRTPLKSGARGSKILITTRNLSVKGCSTCYNLKLLTDEACWSVFKMSAYAGMSKNVAEDLEDIGREIVKHCRGLPLAAKAIGGLLRFNSAREEWRHVLDSILLRTQADKSINPILRLSYDYLPAHLKPCFAYCSLFPSGYEFEKEKLILLWMAEGFLEQSGGLSMEQVGVECFDSLLKMSFFVPAGGSYFKMHHLIRDLAISASGGLFLMSDGNYPISGRTRHLSILTSSKIEDLKDAQRLRTFFLINSPLDNGSSQLKARALEDFLATQKRLRVLSLSQYQNAQLPVSIGELIHLRYLDLSESALESLPESLCSLYYLQSLKLTDCVSLIVLPEGIVKLFNLRHLYIKGTGLQQMPEEMSRLSNLQTLTNFIVGNERQIKDLGALIDLHGTLVISKLQNVSSASDALDAKLEAKRNLSELLLEWSSSEGDPVKDMMVLENLEPSKELKKLTIRFYGGSKFPSWLGDPSFSNIVFLCLGDCSNCSSLPPLGQLPSLEDLIIQNIVGVSRIGHEFYRLDESISKPFLSLKTLIIEGMTRWEEWISLQAEEFPCLQKLYLKSCPNLKGALPESLTSLVELRISECQRLEGLLPRTPDTCEVELSNCGKVRRRSNGDNLSRKDGAEASHFPSSIGESSGYQHDESIGEISSYQHHESKEHDKSNEQDDSLIEDENKEQDDSLIEDESSEQQDDSFLSSSSVIFKVSSIGKLNELPPRLPCLKIEGCDALESLPAGILDRPLLQRLYITDCDQLKTFPQLNQPSSLERLYICNCRNLEFPQYNEMANQFILLENLCLGSSSDPLESFRLNSFPVLKTLCLWDCKNLQALSMEKGLRNHLKSLEVLEIRDCPSLATFPKEGLQAPSMTSLVLSNCNNLKSLPSMQCLTSLESLHINKCRALEPFPPRCLPSSLIILCISFCERIIPQTVWELDSLHSLSRFEIEGECRDLCSFPGKLLLPTNLKSLRIAGLLNLESLDKNGLQQLTSLQSLQINACNELRSLPEDGLPSSLCLLSITDCSTLSWKLQKRKGKEWRKIAHIPSIYLGEVRIS